MGRTNEAGSLQISTKTLRNLHVLEDKATRPEITGNISSIVGNDGVESYNQMARKLSGF